MQTDVVNPRTGPKVKAKVLKVADRVTFGGYVLQVLDRDVPTLLVLVVGSGAKLTIESRWFGAKRRGGDAVTLTATVTRVADGPYSEFTPVSVQVDGYATSRVTLAAKWLSQVE